MVGRKNSTGRGVIPGPVNLESQPSHFTGRRERDSIRIVSGDFLASMVQVSKIVLLFL